jgi:hypothetical protein
MSNRNTVSGLAGDTLKLTWISSGSVAGTIFSNLLDRNHAVVSSVPAVSSGDGHYYALHTLPDSKQWLINRWTAVVNANTYRKSQYVDVQEMWAS